MTIDEVVSFSRQLTTIAFTLYWNEATINGAESSTTLSWDAIRDKLTKLLNAIHAREYVVLSQTIYMPTN